jgi:hypothetical protein
MIPIDFKFIYKAPHKYINATINFNLILLKNFYKIPYKEFIKNHS